MTIPRAQPTTVEVPAGPSRRRVGNAFLVLGGAAFLALLSLAGMAWTMNALSWPHREPLGDPVFGVNFSCNHAEYLLLEDPGGPFVPDDRPGRAQWCAATLGRLHDAVGFTHLRISVEWSRVEPGEGTYNFATLDAMLAEAERRDIRVVLTVGMKAQRHPEYYIPAWLLDRVELPRDAVVSDQPEVRAAALQMAAAVVAHASRSPAIEGWGAENEPYVPSKRANWWALGNDYVRALAGVIRANDPDARPVVINTGQQGLMDRYEDDRRWALRDAEVFAVSLYPFRNHSIFGWNTVLPILELGPIVPNYAQQAREAKDAGREFWITELQAEPWTDDDARLISPENPSQNLTPANFRKNIDYARRTGAARIYLWGAEWWLMQLDRYGDRTWLGLGHEAAGR